MSAPSSRSFTLVDTLVTTGIAATLVALALPAMSSVLQASKRTACLANLKSLHLATFMHMEDHNDLLPFATSGVWVGIGDTAPLGDLARYLDTDVPRVDLDQRPETVSAPFLCPSDRDHASATGFSYAYVPAEFMGIEGQQLVSRRYAAHPRLILFGERGRWHAGEPTPEGYEHLPSGSNAVTLEGELGWNLELQAAGLMTMR